MNSKNSKIEELCVNTIRFLAVDAIERAQSGHPGMPMGAAPTAFTLWTRHMRHYPLDPNWPNRDRFVLSAGHASMLLYALLHLSGYDVSLEDLKAFRQWGSKTPGHPERGITPGVEMTTGPLGQGISHAVGMAAAEAHLAALFNRPGLPFVDHFTYVMVSDGDLMEGVTLEACSLAGHLGLGKLIVLYDDNGVSLAGATALTFSDDVDLLFRARHWQVITLQAGTDLAAIDRAITAAKKDRRHPSLIRVKTRIGYGAPQKEGSHLCHGAPLGKEEVIGAKRRLGWPETEEFYVPQAVRTFFLQQLQVGERHYRRWSRRYECYRERYPEEATAYERRVKGDLLIGWDEPLDRMGGDDTPRSTRKTSEIVLQTLASSLPEIMGGSADLNPSCLTWLKGHGDFQRPARFRHSIPGEVGGGWHYGGRNIHFGVREHAMAAFAGGLAVHGGIIPYTATFLTFADYMRPSIRLAALMKLPVIFVFTHDSFYVGEDGPTHQPVEQLMSLRAIPHLTVIRPADQAETIEAWRAAINNRRGPTALILTRQEVPPRMPESVNAARSLHQGGYVLWESTQGDPEVILIATGSEVPLALAAARSLAARGIPLRVVSLPSWELFEAQPEAYRQQVLPPHVKRRLAIEAGVSLGWERYVGEQGKVMGLDHFGASAPAHILQKQFGFTPERVVAMVQALLAGK